MAKTKLSLIEVANESFLKDLRIALSAPPEALMRVAQEVNSDRGFRVTDEERVAKLWAESEAAPGTLGGTLAVLRHLFNFGITGDKTVDELLEEIQQLCSEKDIPGFDERRDPLRQLLTPSEPYRQRRELLPWAQNVFLNLVGVDASAELRGAFKSFDSEELTAVIPMVILRLACMFDDDKDSQIQRVAMQLTQDDVDYLIRRLTLAKKRLATLKERVDAQTTIFDEIPGGLWRKDRG